MRRAFAIVLSAALLATPCAAQDCSSAVQSAQDNVRNGFIQGMSGLITGSFSNRPGTMASMACLDKFMQGNMDIMFKPPTLTDLLGTVMNFACQAGKSAGGSSTGGGGLNLNSLIGSLAGGLNLGGSSGGPVNLSQILSSATSSSGSSGGSGGASGTGGINGLYTIPGH